MPTQPHPNDREGVPVAIVTALSNSRVVAGFVGGAFSTLGGLFCLISAEAYDAIDAGQFVMFSIPVIFGLLSVVFTGFAYSRVKVGQWMRPLVALGYLGTVLQSCVGAMLIYSAFQMSISDGRQPLILLFGVGSIAASVGLLLGVEDVDRALTGRRRFRSR